MGKSNPHFSLKWLYSSKPKLPPAEYKIAAGSPGKPNINRNVKIERPSNTNICNINLLKINAPMFIILKLNRYLKKEQSLFEEIAPYIFLVDFNYLRFILFSNI